ncbi:facilitated trehalose transporter Tret1-2 homolog [Andrena cerasifolii]|uniref:facilitated trehalose transporter Tret1-2 homolog n=1 Tax=Andrena cerasifolii TaxID=2819439 RepID=UPI00403771C0
MATADVDDQKDFKQLFKRRFPQFLSTIAASTGSFAFGCSIGWSAPCVEHLESDYGYDEFATNLIASALPLGTALGLAMLHFFVDSIGRKGTMLTSAPLSTIGWILIICVISNEPVVVIGRLITGISGGIFCVLAPMYSAEICERHIRGTLGIIPHLLFVTGILYAYCCGFTKNVIATSILCAIAPIISGIVMLLFMPESPLYHLSKGMEEAARKDMRFLRGPNWDIEVEMQALKDQVTEASSETVTLQTFLQKPTLKMIGVVFGLVTALQFSGINVIIFYAVTIFKGTGSAMDPEVQMVIFAVCQVIACGVAVLLVDKLGRKILLGVSASVICICQLSLGSFFYAQSNFPEVAARLSWLPLTAACVLIMSFCFGTGPIPWTYMGEIFPAHLKGVICSAAGFFSWTLSFIMTVSFSTMVHLVGIAALMFFFAGAVVLFLFFIIFCVVETKRKTYVEIQRAFGVQI